MIKRSFVFILSLAFLHAFGAQPLAQAVDAKTAKRIEEVRSKIGKFGTGESANVDVKLTDGRRLKGYVKSSDNDGFVVVDKKTGVEATVTCDQVKQVSGKNLSTGVKIAIGVGIGALVFLILVATGLATPESS